MNTNDILGEIQHWAMKYATQCTHCNRIRFISFNWVWCHLPNKTMEYFHLQGFVNDHPPQIYAGWILKGNP